MINHFVIIPCTYNRSVWTFWDHYNQCRVIKFFNILSCIFYLKAVVLFYSEILLAGRIYMQYFCFWNNNIINKSFESMNLFSVTEMGLIVGEDTDLFFKYVKWVLSVKLNLFTPTWSLSCSKLYKQLLQNSIRIKNKQTL